MRRILFRIRNKITDTGNFCKYLFFIIGKVLLVIISLALSTLANTSEKIHKTSRKLAAKLSADTITLEHYGKSGLEIKKAEFATSLNNIPISK